LKQEAPTYRNRSSSPHHTVSGKNLTGLDLLKNKDEIVSTVEHEIKHGNLEMMADIRRHKKTL